MLFNEYEKAVEIIKNSKKCIAFTGAGISVESGIPPFRGKDGIWNKYDPKILDIDYFLENPKESWRKIKKIFYRYINKAEPNNAHLFLSKLEKKGFLKAVITQNIDALHQKAGSINVIEFHGTAQKTVCMNCFERYDIANVSLDELPPTCPKCWGLLKPDFVFFKEQIPKNALEQSLKLAQEADCVIIIGTSGEIMPASQIPVIAKQNSAKIIEINIEKTKYTDTLSDILLEEKASVAGKKLLKYFE
jgi:NAD-dependent deacetylase